MCAYIVCLEKRQNSKCKKKLWNQNSLCPKCLLRVLKFHAAVYEVRFNTIKLFNSEYSILYMAIILSSKGPQFSGNIWNLNSLVICIYTHCVLYAHKVKWNSVWWFKRCCTNNIEGWLFKNIIHTTLFVARDILVFIRHYLN